MLKVIFKNLKARNYESACSFIAEIVFSGENKKKDIKDAENHKRNI